MENVSILEKLLGSWASLFSLSDFSISFSPKPDYADIKGKPPQTVTAVDWWSVLQYHNHYTCCSETYRRLYVVFKKSSESNSHVLSLFKINHKKVSTEKSWCRIAIQRKKKYPYICSSLSFAPKGKHLSSEGDLVLQFDSKKKDCAISSKRNAFPAAKSLKFPYRGKGGTHC